MTQRRPARESRDRQDRAPAPRPKKSRARPRSEPREPLTAADLAAAPEAGAGEPSSGEPQRLNKYLASHGLGSRRRCDELILSGQVWVDGKPCTELGTRIDPGVQRIEVEGVLLKPAGIRPRYYLMNKPSGVVCTSDEREARARAIDLITDPEKGRIFTVGRLDEETTGLLILTNDGDFAHRIMHPRFAVTKTYMVKLRGRMEDDAVQRIREGVYLAEGKTAGARVVVLQRSHVQTRLEVTLQEGKNREVRRVFANLGYKVVDLKRVRIAHLTDRGLKIGRWRPLTRQEVQELLAAADPLQRAALLAAGKLPKPPHRRGLRTDRGRRGSEADRGTGGPQGPGEEGAGRAPKRSPKRAPRTREVENEFEAEEPRRALPHPLFQDRPGMEAEDFEPAAEAPQQGGAKAFAAADEPRGARGRGPRRPASSRAVNARPGAAAAGERGRSPRATGAKGAMGQERGVGPGGPRGRAGGRRPSAKASDTAKVERRPGESPGERARRELGWQEPGGRKLVDASRGPRGQAGRSREQGPGGRASKGARSGRGPARGGRR
jgi:23S rRNA pseudouridine2605 synthase